MAISGLLYLDPSPDMSVPPPRIFLTREAVLADSIRAYVQLADPALKLSSAEEHRASIQAMLGERPADGDVWLFAYGSLMWNPLIHSTERRVAAVRGFHRRFCLWTHLGRGTSERPGLTLALEPGGACRGIAYRIAEAKAAAELELVWRREMLTGAYRPRWLKLTTAEGPLHAIGFVVNRRHVRYAGRLAEAEVVAALAEANGPLGSCAAYLFDAVSHLEALGVHDRQLTHLRDKVVAWISGAGETTPDTA
jgi:cation transport protein ChaC